MWFHAASLGEFEQGRPIMERLRREHPELKILLTFFSPSGYEVRKNYEGADIICYLPLDTYFNARRFLNLVHPEVAFFIKYEFWWNYLHILKRRNVPVYSVSSIFRPNQVFFRWYGRTYSNVLKCFTRFFVQNEVSRQLLAKLGITEVEITGDTRFDRVLDICWQAKDLPLVKAFKQDAKVLVAGSSWAPDEDLIIPYFNAHPEMKLVLAPHVVSEDHLKEIEGKLRRPFVRYSRVTEESAARADCLIIDGYGLLSSIYRYGEMAYVGGGFGVGIHNTLEAATFGLPIAFGPNYEKFKEARDLVTLGAATPIHSYEELKTWFTPLRDDEHLLQQCSRIAKDYTTAHQGATNIVLHTVFGKPE